MLQEELKKHADGTPVRITLGETAGSAAGEYDGVVGVWGGHWHVSAAGTAWSYSITKIAAKESRE